jgi:Rieske 2Fe-2S family protein
MAPLPLSPDEIRAVLLPLDEARTLPSLAYVDEGVLAYEREAILAPSWQVVGREEDVHEPGQWTVAPIVPEGVLVVRGADLELRAFYNVCPHRGATLVSTRAGRASALVCPYHGFTYDLAGRLREAPHACDPAFRGRADLSPVRVSTWMGFVFVALDASAPPLDRWIEPAPPWLSRSSVSHAKRLYAATYSARANWKLLAENFQESHHFTRVHPSLEPLTPNDAARSHLLGDRWLGGSMPLVDGVETVSVSRSRRGRPFLAAPDVRRQVSDALLFPLVFTSLQPDYLLTYRLGPVTPGETRVAFEIFVHPGATDTDAALGDLVPFWERINEEDRAICERQQLGVASRAYRPAPYTSVEDGVHAFDALVARAYESASSRGPREPTAPRSTRPRQAHARGRGR